MDLCSRCACPAGRIRKIHKLYNSFFIPAVAKGIVALHHFIPLPATLTLAGDHKFSRKQNLLASSSVTHFN